MKKILVLGAGMVSKPLVQYLLNQQDYFVKMVSRTLSKAEKNIDGHKNGIAEALDVEDKIRKCLEAPKKLQPIWAAPITHLN